MKVLVAGRGFIGKNVVSKLRDNHEIKTLDKNPDATYQQDITENFEIGEEFDVLIHTVGLAPGMHSPEEYEDVHVNGTRNLLEAVDAEKVIFLSALGAGTVEHSFLETKRRAEKIVKTESEKYTILRPSTVYGRENKLLEMIRRAAPTMVFPDIRTLTQQQVLKLGGREEITVGDMAKRIYAERGFPCMLVPVPTVLQKVGLTMFSPLPGPFNREDIKLLQQENTTEINDAEKIMGELKEIP
jgi:nucleoside-diphosphate-sugar epimerase